MLRPALPLVVLTTACVHPVPITQRYGQAPPVAAPHPVVVLAYSDLRGRHVESSGQFVTVDLPDTASTTVRSYGNTTSVRSTYSTNEVTIATGHVLGSDFVAVLNDELAAMSRVTAASANLHVVDARTLPDLTDPHLQRLALDHRAASVVLLQVSEASFETDAQANALAWSYGIGATLGIAALLIPLEIWDARVTFVGDAYLWDPVNGITRRQPIEIELHHRGHGIPSYRRVNAGVTPWAATRIAEATWEAIDRLR